MTLISVSQLPKTRLELRWRQIPRDEDGYTMVCDYELVLELDELDIRGEVYDDDGGLVRRDREKRLTLGGTRTTGNTQRLLRNGEIDTPFRDGSHILWDALKLKIPAFVVLDDMAMDVIENRRRIAFARGEEWPPRKAEP